MVETDLLYAFVKKEDWLKATVDRIIRRIVDVSSAWFTRPGNAFTNSTMFQGGRG